jgi:hypothetical protein
VKEIIVLYFFYIKKEYKHKIYASDKYITFYIVLKMTTTANNTNDTTDFDIVDVINTVLPFEKHLPGMRYCGPGTKLDLRLDENMEPLPGCEPVDRVDKAALKHDIAYNKHGDLRHRLAADKEMLHELYDIEQPTCRESVERCIVVPILFLKRLIGSLILKIFPQL